MFGFGKRPAPASSTPGTAVAGKGSSDSLASTVFNGSWLLLFGLALLAAGAAVVATLKLRRPRR